MKILHTSDLHLGISLCGAPLLPYQKKLCENLCELAEQADAVVIPGDIFDTSVASAEAVKLWSGLASGLCLGKKKPVIVCAGNHDGAARLASCAELLKPAGLYISGTIEDAFSPVDLGDTAVYSLPYFNPTEAAALLGCKPTAADAMRAVCGRILETADPSKCNVLAAHCFAAGAGVSESDVSAKASEAVGGADCIPPDVFSGFDYAALGHLHRAQSFSSGKTIIRYSGAPLPYSFGEATHRKTVTIFDTETRGVTETDVPQPYNLRVIEAGYDEIIGLAENDSGRDDLMKITVTDRYGGDGIFMTLKELYPNMLSFSGKQYEASETSSVTAREAAELDMLSLAVRYSEEHRGEAPDEDELRWLAEAFGEIIQEN